MTKYAWEGPPTPTPVGTRMETPVYVLARRTDGGAIASMILGIVGLVMIPLIASIVALALGYGARNRMRARSDLDGVGFATAGIVTGWIGVILPVVTFLAFLAASSG